MLTFCTLFDSRYLSRGLALYESLERHCKSFALYIVAFDEIAYSILASLRLSHARIISLQEFEDEELLRVKPTRTRAEYCWTSTSSAILYILERYQPDHCTYVDADLYFYDDPKVLIDELGNDSILITEHRYTPIYDKSKISGKYCVQFITFKRNEEGLTALRWWRDACLEWCYDRIEDGKFGDQKYLDDWPTRFRGVHVMQHLGGGLAPWNVQQYEFEQRDHEIYGKELSTGREFKAVFYHFHYVRFFTNSIIELGRRKLLPEVIEIFYKPYLSRLEAIKNDLHGSHPSLDAHGATDVHRSWKTPLVYAWRKTFGHYHVYDLRQFLEG